MNIVVLNKCQLGKGLSILSHAAVNATFDLCHARVYSERFIYKVAARHGLLQTTDKYVSHSPQRL